MGRAMDTAGLFQSGRSQPERLPKDSRLSGSEVAVQHIGNGMLQLPIDDPWQTLEAGLAAFEPDFVLEREQPVQQQRVAINP
jgi:antitoxin VapB